MASRNCFLTFRFSAPLDISGWPWRSALDVIPRKNPFSFSIKDRVTELKQ